MKHIHFPLILLTIMLACNLFTACNDDEGGGIPVIHHIRLTDPEKADSTFTDVNPGTMIVAIGENLNGVKKVFINQQEVSFNSNYSTSTNLILTIPADLPLVGANPDLKDELRIETTHGTAIYSMHVLSPAPYITRIATTFPVEVGTPLRVIGGNFYEIQRIYFTTAEGDITDAPVSTEITEFTVNKDFSEISFKAPAGLIDEGSLVVECYTAAAFTPFRRTALPPSINKVSSMMPITGTTVTVLGQNFMDIASITMGGTAEVPGFYPLENIVLNYDDIGSFSWGGFATAITADGSVPPYFSDGQCYQLAGELSAWNWWWGQLQNTAVWNIDAAFLPAATPTSELALQFECFVAQEYGEGPVFRIYLKGNEAHNYTDYRPMSDFTGKTEVGQWMQCSIPLSALVDEATWGKFQSRSGEELALQMTNPSGNGPYNIEMYFDNFRIVKIQ